MGAKDTLRPGRRPCAAAAVAGGRVQRLVRFPRRIARHARLLRDDPELFGRNLLQYVNPALFEQRLDDVLRPTPMQVSITPGPGAGPRLNVLDGTWVRAGMTGGPNTVINLMLRVARLGVPVRLVTTVSATDIDPGWMRRHAAALLGGPAPELPIVAAHDPAAPLALGPGDVFLATHWRTAQQLKSVLPRLPARQFLYMLQEFEPGFYGWSSNYALAIETFGMDFWPVVNESMLADHLFAQPFGRLPDPETRRRAVVFEPAVDATLFHPPPAEAPARPRRLLFYARPSNTRNMFGLGLDALRRASADPAFAGWEFLSIGTRGSVPALKLAGGHALRPAPWVDYAGYGELLRAADVLLCPMLSPHTSYPVLEMAACGGLSVTNVFATKTAERLAALSPNIVATPATLEGLVEGLLAAAGRAAAPRAARLDMARDWGAALDPAARRIAEILPRLAG